MVADNGHEVFDLILLTVPVQLAVEVQLGIAVTVHHLDMLNGRVHSAGTARKQFALETEAVVDRKRLTDVAREMAL